MKRINRWTIFGAPLGILFLLILACVLQSIIARSQAQSLEEALQKITVGVTTEAQAKEVFGRFRPEDRLAGGRVLNTTAWGPSYSTTSKGLSILHLARLTSFSVSVIFNEGIVVRKSASLRVDGTGSCCIIEVEESSYSFSDLPAEIMKNGIFIREKDGFVHVYLDGQASEQNRKAAFGFNAACISSIPSCATVDQVLPSLKHAKQIADNLNGE